MALQREVMHQKNKRLSMAKAEEFNKTRLKLKMLRSFAILTLRAEKARLAAANRRTLRLSVKSTGVAHRLQLLWTNRVPIRAQRPLMRSNKIQKNRLITLCHWHRLLSNKEVRKIE